MAQQSKLTKGNINTKERTAQQALQDIVLEFGGAYPNLSRNAADELETVREMEQLKMFLVKNKVQMSNQVLLKAMMMNKDIDPTTREAPLPGILDLIHHNPHIKKEEPLKVRR